jgi:hypothetical protein
MPRDLEADLAICEDATPGPWRVVGRNYALQGFPQVEMNTPEGHYFSVNFPYDADFIATARTSWPETIQYAMQLEGEIDRLQNELNILQEQLNRRWRP